MHKFCNFDNVMFAVHGKNCMKWHEMGRKDLFPANPNLADVLGGMDLDFENFHVFDLLDSKFLDFQVPRFPKSGPSLAWAGPGQAWAIWTKQC